MEFLLLDLALALAAALGYRILQEAARGAIGLGRLSSAVRPRAPVIERAGCARGAPHRLINFW